jgi:hypothetical protein
LRADKGVAAAIQTHLTVDLDWFSNFAWPQLIVSTWGIWEGGQDVFTSCFAVEDNICQLLLFAELSVALFAIKFRFSSERTDI